MEQASKDEGEAAYARKIIQFLEDRMSFNESLSSIYNGQASEERTDEFFEISKKKWIEALPDTLGQLEEAIEGPYLFGDEIVSRSLNRHTESV